MRYIDDIFKLFRLQEHKIAFVANRKFPKDRPALNMSQVFFGLFYSIKNT